MRSGPSVYSTASRWRGLRLSRMDEEAVVMPLRMIQVFD
jgi:hypothetical protein